MTPLFASPEMALRIKHREEKKEKERCISLQFI
jgi:hypothetical protein